MTLSDRVVEMEKELAVALAARDQALLARNNSDARAAKLGAENTATFEALHGSIRALHAENQALRNALLSARDYLDHDGSTTTLADVDAVLSATGATS